MSQFNIKSYDHGGVLLNISGTRESANDGCDVEKITAADSAIDLFDLFTPSDIERIAYQAELILDGIASQFRHEVNFDSACAAMIGGVAA